METIRSASHPLLKRVRAAAAGRGEGEMLLEGDRLVDEARSAGLALEVVLVDEERSERRAELERLGLPVRAVRGSVIASVSSLHSAPGCLALAPEPPSPLHPERQFMHLALHIYDTGFKSPNADAARPLVFTATLLLIGIILVLNLAAISFRAWLRQRFSGAR